MWQQNKQTHTAMTNDINFQIKQISTLKAALLNAEFWFNKSAQDSPNYGKWAMQVAEINRMIDEAAKEIVRLTQAAWTTSLNGFSRYLTAPSKQNPSFYLNSPSRGFFFALTFRT